MVIAADYPFLDVFWTMVIFFTWVVWIWMMVIILTDVFRRRDIGGWAKAAWVLFLLVLPFLAALVYLIAQHDGMADRNLQQSREMEQQFDQRVQQAAARDGGGPASEIEKAHRLLEQGTITQEEFNAIKDKALAPA